MKMTYYRRTEADGTTTWVALPTKAGHWHTPPPGWVMEERCPVDVARVAELSSALDAACALLEGDGKWIATTKVLRLRLAPRDVPSAGAVR